MALTTNPQYRLIRAPEGAEPGGGVQLPPWLRAGRAIAYLLVAALMVFFLAGGTLESRAFYLIAFFIAAVNPVWGLYSLALMGPMFLMDPFKTHLLAGLEVFLLGIVAGELRMLGRPIVGLDAAGVPSADYSLGGKARRVHWGAWPHFLVGLVLLLLSSSLIGMRLVWFQDKPYQISPWRLFNIVSQMFYGAATQPEYTLRALWNWSTGALLAVIVARRANPLVIARWMKLGGISLFVACVFGLLDWIGWLPLTDLRRANPDPLQWGRLQGTAGHAGWFGQWIVLMWPGLLLWWSRGRMKRNGALVCVLALVCLCLVLTAARAAWLGVGVAVAAGCLYTVYTYPETRRMLPWAIGGAAAIALLGVVAGGETLRMRLVHILRAQDRANYYVTGLMFLREHPFGLGLGTHYQFYEWTFTPFFRWYQKDHVTAHSLWLHTLIENGVFVPVMLMAGLAGLWTEVKRSLKLFDPHTRTILVALSLGIAGIITVSIAQYIAYIRIVELACWIGAGAIAGLCRKKRCRIDEKVDSWRGRRVLLACGAAALIIASMNAGRTYVGAMPRSYDQGNWKLDFWTDGYWRTPIESDVESIRFTLYRKALPAFGTITWPDGSEQSFEIGPEEYKSFVYTQAPSGPVWHGKPEYVEIRVRPTFVPRKHLEGSTDERPLGVYVGDFRVDSHRIREIKQGAE